MRRTWFVATVVCFLLVGTGRADDDKKKSTKLPKAIAEVVKTKFPNAKVAGVEKEDSDGESAFEVKLKYKEGSLEVLFSPKGNILKVELKGEENEDHGKKKQDDEDDDEKGSKKAKKGENGEKGEKKSKKGEDEDDDEKGSKKAKKGENGEKGEKKSKKGEDEDDDEKSSKKAKKKDDNKSAD